MTTSKQQQQQQAARRGRRRKDEARLPSALSREDVDAMAKRRCLMLLAVLSGQTTISQAVKDAQISSGTYYQLETRALNAMLEALAPMTTTQDGSERSRSFGSLQARVKHLEQEKRRLERLLAMTTKIVRPGPMKTAMGRGSKKKSRTRSTQKPVDKKIERDQPSTSTTAGAVAP